jgi:DNA-binding SARP family transcriptional activator
MLKRPSVVGHEIDIDLLGALQVWVDGRDCTPAGRIRRTVVGLLALRAGRIVVTETLIDQVWSGSPPASARPSLQMHITHIRRHLGVTGVITSPAGGYRLELAEDRVDARRFETQVRDGLAHLAADRFRRAADSLGTALTIWSEPPLPDLAHLEVTRGYLVELELLHHEAQIGRATALLQMAGSSPDVGALERLTQRHPLDERAWWLLAVGHYRAAGGAAALNTLDRARKTLFAELGIGPGPRLREVEAMIRAPDASS